MRVGLFGGSFNPIHLGHLRAAEEVREELALDLVYFVPAAIQPLKTQAEFASAEHRLEMVRLATKGNRHFMVSDAEIKRGGQSYTIDTVRQFLSPSRAPTPQFRSTFRAPASLFLIMGSDAFSELETWKDYTELTRLCSIVVHTRHREGDSTPPRVSLAALGRLGYIIQGDHYVHQSGQTLSFLLTTSIPISATVIRNKLQQGKSIRYLVPDDVGDYVTRHGLYASA
jgi:nicotinate-nucleotide adenylyltransferase